MNIKYYLRPKSYFNRLNDSLASHLSSNVPERMLVRLYPTAKNKLLAINLAKYQKKSLSTTDFVSDNLITFLAFLLFFSLAYLSLGIKAHLDLKIAFPFFNFSLALICAMASTVALIVSFIYAFPPVMIKVVTFVHLFLPGKRHRDQNLLEKFEQNYNRIKYLYVRKVTEEPQEEFLGFTLKQEYKILGVKKFCIKYFNIKSPNFHKFYEERVDREGCINYSFLVFSTHIPKIKELSSDALRRILLCPLHFSLHSDVAKLKIIFQDYTTSQIETIFTNDYGKDRADYVLRLSHPALVYRSFSELLDGEFKAKTPVELEPLNNDTKYPQFEITVLKTLRQHRETSDLFSNCIRDYFFKEGNVIRIMRGNQPIACVHVINKKIQAAESTHSKPLPSRSIVFELLEHYGITY